MNIRLRRASAVLLSTILAYSLAPASILAGEARAAEGDSGDGLQISERVLSKTASPSVKYRVKHGGTWSATVANGSSAGTGKVNTVRVYKPAITTTVKTEFSATQDGAQSTWTENTKDTVSYGLTLKVGVIGAGTKTGSYNDDETYRQYSSAKAVQNVAITPSAAFKKTGYHLYYRVKLATFGWTGWAKDGALAGSKLKVAVRALQVKVAKSAPGSTAHARIGAPTLRYAVDLAGKNAAINSYKKGGAAAGKALYSAKTERLRAKVGGGAYKGGVSYRVRTGKGASGWSAWAADGATCGTDGSAKGSKRGVQAVQMKLTGALAKYYNIYYSVYCGDHHWLGWAKNGQTAGTGKIGYALGAVKAVVVAKGAAAPGSTKGHYVSTKVKLKGAKLKMLRKAQKFSSATGYLILVNRASCHVAVFTGSHDDWTMKYYWSCCVGKPSTPTIKGTFSTKAKLYSFGEEKGYSCYYATQISGNYLFHSILYYKNTRSVMDATMGAHVSHGCVRLATKNAHWIYNNVGRGSTVHIY